MITDILSSQRKFFGSGETRKLTFRIDQLKKLKKVIKDHEGEILKALYEDLHKPKLEAYASEVGFLYEDIESVIKNLKKWITPQRTTSPLILLPSHGEVWFEPYGVVLIIAPWNYPVQLLLSPLIGAIAAGNCAVLKPSEIAPHTENLLTEIINENFCSNYIYAVKGGVEESGKLLKEKFDYIFFTGSTSVGKIVMKAASEHLTPVTLELGGKSPCIVDKKTNLDVTARRITWGKFFNAGQTCVAPDYVYVHNRVKDALLDRIKHYIQEFYSSDPSCSHHFGRIVNERHFNRLVNLIDKKKIYTGGLYDRENLYIAPTVLSDVTWQDPIMQEEIFGPLLPLLSFEKLEDVIQTVNEHPKPLALYVFSEDKVVQEKVLSQISFGGGCINDCLVHLSNSRLPFGGVGNSGIGAYHGRYSFESFSHRKGILKRSFFFDPKLRYAPYSDKKLSLIKLLQR